MMGNSAGANDQLKALLARQEAEMAKNAEKIMDTLNGGKLAAGSGANAVTSKGEKGSPKGAGGDKKVLPLTPAVDTMLKRFLKLKLDLDSMEATLASNVEALEALQGKLNDADSNGDTKIIAVQEMAKKERAQLVSTALESLRHLRTHLVSALSGLREVITAPTSPGAHGRMLSTKHGDRLVWAPHDRSWHIESEGQRDQLVMRLEFPPTMVGVRAPVGASRSPRIIKGLTYETHEPAPPRFTASRLPSPRAVSRAQHHDVRSQTASGTTRRGAGAGTLPDLDDRVAPEPLGQQGGLEMQRFAAMRH